MARFVSSTRIRSQRIALQNSDRNCQRHVDHVHSPLAGESRSVLSLRTRIGLEILLGVDLLRVIYRCEISGVTFERFLE